MPGGAFLDVAGNRTSSAGFIKLVDGAFIATSEDLSVAIGRNKPGADS